MYILKRQFVQLKINNMLQLLYPKQKKLHLIILYYMIFPLKQP